MQDSYKELFLSESAEYLNTINQCLVKLEENPQNLESLNEIFRCMHTLKGMSATMGYEKLTQLTHHMEDLLDELRSQKKKLTSAIMDVLFASVDILEKLFDEIKSKRESTTEIAQCLLNIKQFLGEDAQSAPSDKIGAKKGKELPKEKDAALPQSAAAETLDLSLEQQKQLQEYKAKGLNPYLVNVVLAKDCVMKEARAYLVITNFKKMGEIVKAMPGLDELKLGQFDRTFSLACASRESQESIRKELLSISEIENITVSPIELSEKIQQETPVASAATPSYVKKIQSMRIPVERLDKIMNLMGELAIAKIRLLQIVQTYKIEPLEEVSFMFDRLISELQDEIMQTRLLPVAYILDTFPRVVRDLARREGKDVDLQISGSEIELDRVALDELGDPLVHLVRNAIDHGLESPEDRKKLGKNPRGKLSITVSRQKGQINIEVIDDGKGVDFEGVKMKAIRQGLLTAEEASSIEEKKILDIIALPGFSTAAKVSDISGRGVGLDVVKTKIEALGGRLEFETKKNEGSRFILTLPLTLAIIKAMLVRVGNQIFAVPLMSVRETIKVRPHDIKVMQNMEITKVRDELIPVVRLTNELGIEDTGVQNPDVQRSEHQKEEDERISLVIVESGKRTMGFAVSQVLGEQDVVVKSLGALIKKTKGISGATILGDGRVALILDAGLR